MRGAVAFQARRAEIRTLLTIRWRSAKARAREFLITLLGKLPILADSGYEGAGAGVHVPVKRPARGELDIDTRTRNALLRSLRYQGERGFALMSQRWRAIQHVSLSPTTIGAIAKSALVLTQFEHKPRVPWGRRDGVKIPGAAALRLAGVARCVAGAWRVCAGFPPLWAYAQVEDAVVRPSADVESSWRARPRAQA